MSSSTIAATFGEIVAGTEAEPGVYMESVHHLMKTVAGAPNIRPAWFFDTAEQGEGLNDIGTHLVDLVQWTLFPGRAIDYRVGLARAGGAALAHGIPQDGVSACYRWSAFRRQPEPR